MLVSEPIKVGLYPCFLSVLVPDMENPYPRIKWLQLFCKYPPDIYPPDKKQKFGQNLKKFIRYPLSVSSDLSVKMAKILFSFQSDESESSVVFLTERY